MVSTVSESDERNNGGSAERTGERDSARPRRRKKKAAPHRWRREAYGIIALAAAVFGLVAVATFDPTLPVGEQGSPVGTVGAWLGFALYRGFGHAGLLFPLLTAFWGVAAFVRAPSGVRWVSVAGIAALIASATALLDQLAPAAAGETLQGGILGWALGQSLRLTVGNVGAWLVPLAAIPVALLLVTQVSYAAVSRVVARQVRRFRRTKRGKPAAELSMPALTPEIALPDAEPAALVVVEPSRPRTLVEQGLTWQETFDFGKDGAASFQLPPVGLLKAPPPSELKRSREELQENADTLRKKLEDFEVEGRIVQVSPGPIITSYEFEPAPGIKVSQIVNLADDLALALKAASVRIMGPIAGRGTVAIEVPNSEMTTVYLREIFMSAEFAESKGKLPLALGKDVTGQAVVADLAAMPHLLVAGATGSGKSVGLNSMICSILYKATPAEVRFLLIDPKRLELSIYEGIPHLLSPVVTDAKEAAARLRWIVGKMDERYKELQIKQVRNIEGYNRAVEPEKRLPYWVVVVDELADLMMVSAGEVQGSLVRLAQIARAVGIHLIVATQRPSVDVVTGLIKANFPTRIAFQMASKVDSRTVLDSNGAEQLLGRGDMIFVPPGASKATRVHGAWVNDDEVKAICDFLRKQATAVYEEVVLPTDDSDGAPGDAADRDDLYWDAVHLVIGQRQASISFLQRRMRLGYPKAARFVDMMEQDRIIGPGDGSKPREVLVGPEYLQKRGKLS